MKKLFNSSVLQLKSSTLVYYNGKSVIRLNMFFEILRISAIIIYWRYKYVSDLQMSHSTK